MTASFSEPMNQRRQSRCPRPTRTEAAERESARDGIWSRIWRAARVILVDFGRYGPNGEYYLFQGGKEEPVAWKSEDILPRGDARQASVISADPYGLISRWKVQQENGNQ